MRALIEKLSAIEHGFKPIEAEALFIFRSNDPGSCQNIAAGLLQNNAYQARSLAVFILGYISSAIPEALHTLKTKVSRDESWQVQEILAKAFDRYCSDTGYKKALPVINEWLADENPNVCRAVIEGLRIWTGRPYFKEHPEIAIELISRHKDSESEYLRKSVGNSLRDISKKHKDLIGNEISGWDLNDKKVLFTWKYVTKSKK
jgi:3-methyladenine DNA glycosylase AlkC